MIMASHSTFPAKMTICLAKANLARQIYYTLSMESLLTLKKITIFSPYHKH